MRKQSDNISEYSVTKLVEWMTAKATNQQELQHTQSKPFLSFKENLDLPGTSIDFPELTLKGSNSSHKNVINEKTYYTSPIDEGFANIEVVVDSSNRKNEHHESEEEEIFTATPFVEYDVFSGALDKSNSEVIFESPAPNQDRKQSESRSVFKPFQFDTASETDTESDDFFKLLSDASSSGEEYLPSLSSDTLNCDTPEEGNLPFLDKLDAVEKDGPIFKPPLNTLVSERTPTATISYLSEPSLAEASLTSSSKSLQKEDNTFVKNKEKQKESVTTAENNLSKFCSTNVQSALLTKISHSEVFDLGVNTSFDFDFPRISSPIRAFRKVSKSSLKVKSATNLKEDMGIPTRSYRKTFEGDITADLENFETEVDKAFEESVSEGSFMPLLKQELQCKIQVRRLSRGQPELVLEPEKPKKYELTPEEIKKKNARLEQNRKSARRARSKARIHEKRLLKTIKNEMTENARLTKEETRLRKIRDAYKEAFETHLKSCTKGNIR